MVVNRAYNRIHGHTPHARADSGCCQGHGIIRRTMINTGTLGVSGQSGMSLIGQQCQVGRLTTCQRIVIHDSGNPSKVESWFYWGNCITTSATSIPIVGREPVIVVTGIHDPSQCYLFAIAQARDALGFCLGLGQRGQKHRRQNGDDGNHDQQFYQREPATTLPMVCRPKYFFQFYNAGLHFFRGVFTEFMGAGPVRSGTHGVIQTYFTSRKNTGPLGGRLVSSTFAW